MIGVELLEEAEEKAAEEEVCVREEVEDLVNMCVSEAARESVNDNVIDMRLEAIKEEENLRKGKKKQRKAEK